jgi:hypothetical protein
VIELASMLLVGVSLACLVYAADARSRVEELARQNERMRSRLRELDDVDRQVARIASRARFREKPTREEN